VGNVQNPVALIITNVQGIFAHLVPEIEGPCKFE